MMTVRKKGSLASSLTAAGEKRGSPDRELAKSLGYAWVLSLLGSLCGALGLLGYGS